MNKSKLKSYLSTAGALIAGGTAAQAGIVYTNVDPDTTLFTNETYQLDLDNDGNSDFNIMASSYYYPGMANVRFVQFAGSSSNNQALGTISSVQIGTSSTSVYQANALNSGDNISNGQSTWMTYGFLAAFGTYSAMPIDIGDWRGAQDKYIGLRFNIGGNTHYGWARLDVSGNVSSFTIKDYAYNDVPNEMITAGQMPAVIADAATNVMAADVANNEDGRDLEVSFTKAVDEATISEYRMIVVKSDSVSNFDLVKAQAVTSANYTSVVPNGSDIQQTLLQSSTDADGDAIGPNIDYNVFVLNVADGAAAQLDSLSPVSNVVRLEIPQSNAVLTAENNDYTAYTYGSHLVAINQSESLSTSLFVMDLNGRTIIREKLNQGKSEFDLSSVPSGNYIVQIQDVNGRYNKQVHIE